MHRDTDTHRHMHTQIVTFMCRHTRSDRETYTLRHRQTYTQ